MTLRMRLALAAGLAVALAVAVAALVVYFAVRSELRGEIDHSLRQRASAATDSLRFVPDREPFMEHLAPRALPPPRFGGAPGVMCKSEAPFSWAIRR